MNKLTKAQKVLTKTRELMCQIEVDKTLLSQTVGNNMYQIDKKTWNKQTKELYRFLNVYETDNKKTVVSLKTSIVEYLHANPSWYLQNLPRTDREYILLLKMLEKTIREPYSVKTIENIGKYSFLTRQEQDMLTYYLSTHKKNMSVLNSLTTRVHKTAKRSATTYSMSEVSGLLLNIVQNYYSTRFVKEIKIVQIVRSEQQVREGMTSYFFMDPIVEATLRVKLEGDNHTYTFVYHDQSMTGGGRLSRVELTEGQIFSY